MDNFELHLHEGTVLLVLSNPSFYIKLYLPIAWCVL